MLSFEENRFICVVDNAEKIQIFSVQTRSFVLLNDACVLNKSFVNDTSLAAITPN